MKKTNMLKAAEFAKLCDVSKDTILYYDRMGLLIPAMRSPNGSRFYYTEQLNTFHIISFLRKAGCSIKDIKLFLDAKKPQDYLEMMEDKYQALLLQRKELERSIQSMKLLNYVLSLSESAIVLMVNAPSLYITPMTEEEASDRDERNKKYYEHISACRMNPSIDDYPIGYIFSPEDIINGRLTAKGYYSVCNDDTPGSTPGETGFRYREVISTDSLNVLSKIQNRIKKLQKNGIEITDTVKCDVLLGNLFQPEHMSDNSFDMNCIVEIYIPFKITNLDNNILIQDRWDM